MVTSIPISLGFLVVSLGLFFLVTANFYDSAGHWFGIPESFFSPAHAAVYVGVAITIFGSIWVLIKSCSYIRQSNKYENKGDNIESSLGIKFGLSRRSFSSAEMFRLSIKMIFYGIITLILAGPFDFAWHAAFGLDGLLSPPHAVFRAGQAVCGIGSLLGIVSIYGGINSKSRNKTHAWLYPISIIITVAGLWAGFIRCINMVTLPFSNTGYFDLNPNPIVAAVIATIAFPLFNSLMLYCSFRLGNLHNQHSEGIKGTITGEHYHPKFGILTITATAYLAIITFTIIASNKNLLSTAPLYALNVIPIFVIDMILTKVYSNSARKTSKKIGEIVAGGVLGLLFLSLHYPYITFTYNEIVDNPEYITSKNIATTYITTIQELPFLSFPAITSGIVGIIIGVRLFSSHRSNPQIKTE